ncbi:unnamed protein product (macronuclear) [Paramecium tetraurelia]|uniref:Uncharacterized protein n=1 Tax=Paramecium tetraurelia TaxID=5888 RepID=A0CV73_PARTE|nr:uncharacterized protein GSPATT00010858001 [Paramecium tetraurelia]CAK74690.1 unnamed protein product [Paramecium tetraurelia]|eukprot:XP_001442087.1 hypothetical protein (macronuclear) [Paramecium tetraurelia strain d4-2]
MQQSSFMLSNQQYGSMQQLRKDVKDQLFTRFQNQKNPIQQVKEKGIITWKPLAKTTQSPKSPRTQQVTPQQSPLRAKQYSKHSPGRLSFQRSSLELNAVNSSLMIPKKTLNEIVPVEKIQHLVQSLRSQNYGASDLYMQELRKLSILVLNE